MDLCDHFKFSLDCEINDGERKVDRLRAGLMQLQTVVKEVGGGVMLERQKELLKQYGHEADREVSNEKDYSAPNTWIDMRHSFKISDARSIQPNTWKCHLAKDIENGKITSGQLLEQLNPALAPFRNVSKSWKDFEKKKLNMLKYINREITDATIQSEKIDISVPESPPKPPPQANPARSKIMQSSRGSPVRCSGLFHPRSRSKQSSSNSDKSSQSSTGMDNNKEAAPVQLFRAESVKNSFVTGLEKRMMDQVENKEKTAEQANEELQQFRNRKQARKGSTDVNKAKSSNGDPLLSDDRLRNIEPEMIDLIRGNIITNLDGVGWKQIAGLKSAKAKIQEIAIMPLLRPDLFQGLRSPPKGILLFGPPGTGKTMIGRCIASQAKATFFSITSSTLTSKWIGDGEKAMRTMFEVARCLQPSVIFIDEIDSLLKSRSDEEHESSRRMKTEFLSQFDGLGSDNKGLLMIGTTNRPQDLDEAVRRRFAAKLYVPFPDVEARKEMLVNNLHNERNSLTESELEEIASKTDGFSGSDMSQLCTEAAYNVMKEFSHRILNLEAHEIRPISAEDFRAALSRIKPSVSAEVVAQFEAWNEEFGFKA